jgi:hypothetical protein
MRLLLALAADGFDAFITVDKNLPYQHHAQVVFKFTALARP